MNKINLPLYFFVTSYGVLLGAYFYYDLESNQLSAISTYLAGLSILWYTWETKQLRCITYRQYEEQIRPLVIFKICNNNLTKCEIENIGNGIALNIRIEDIIINGDTGTRIEFPKAVRFLRSKDQTEIKCDCFRNDELINDGRVPLLPNLDPKHACMITEMTIRYENIEGACYTTIRSVANQADSIRFERCESNQKYSKAFF